MVQIAVGNTPHQGRLGSLPLGEQTLTSAMTIGGSSWFCLRLRRRACCTGLLSRFGYSADRPLPAREDNGRNDHGERDQDPRLADPQLRPSARTRRIERYLDYGVPG